MSISIINTNLHALNAQRGLASTAQQMSTALQRLSSGQRINSARDDAAGLSIANRLGSQIRGLDQGVRNTGDAISLALTAEGGLASITENLQRMRELAVQSANFTNTSADRAALQLEAVQLYTEITRVGNQTSFNGLKLLDGSFTAQNVQVGAKVGEVISLAALPDVRSTAIGIVGQSTLSWTTPITAGPSAVQQVQLGAAAPVTLGIMQQDAKLLAAAINTVGAAGIPGLSASAAPNTKFGAAATASPTTANYTFTLNGRVITLAGSSDTDNNRAIAVAAINSQTVHTGVVATDLGSGVMLTEAGGGNIRLAETTAGSSYYFGLGGLVSVDGLGSSVTINYTVPPNEPTKQLVFSGTGMATSSFTIPQRIPISAIDLSTASTATLGIGGIDAALSTISQARASLGAAMNRFEAAISAQRIGVEAQTASRSRIRDADFASETASLTRTKILQQSGIAILAQANTLPQNVLTLLK
jgi:flagellin